MSYPKCGGWTSAKHLRILVTTITCIWELLFPFCSISLFCPSILQLFEAWLFELRNHLSIKSAPDSAFHTPRPILSSYNSSWRWPVATATGSALRTSISLPRHMAMHSSTEMWQLYKPRSWIEALPSVSWSICLVWKVAVQNSTTWLCKSTPCIYSENGTEREIPVHAAMSRAVAGDHIPPHWCAFYIYFKSNLISTLKTIPEYSRFLLI